MSDVAIRVESLGKQYRVGTRERYKTLRDTMTDALAAPFRRARSLIRRSGNEVIGQPDDRIWALQDVSFEVPRGSVLGVIGRNGAGKSTLLKILSRITEPTEGQVEIDGRVGSLLEVGTGFHSELTGRENVFLNGAILGMRKAEILRKFDEIVAFAEVERFIDTPVKRYSSGMYMRLAFAVAAHLEPDILIVDEVLAVGDIQFQKKCLGKMSDAARGGRTVLVVSHQMNQIRRLCTTCVWLDNGRVRHVGSANDAISEYEHSFSARAQSDGPVESSRSGRTHFVSWMLDGTGTDDSTTLTQDRDLTFIFRLHAATPVKDGHHGIALYNSDNLLIWAYGVDHLSIGAGDHDLCYTFPVLPITPGVYHWVLSLYNDDGLVDLWNAIPPLRVHTPLNTHSSDAWQGVLNPSFSMAVRELTLSGGTHQSFHMSRSQ
jgi:ABC-type polysaccharide/polyol phosphate transport system ATPase subunit